MSKMKDELFDIYAAMDEQEREYEKPEYVQAGITRETLDRMKKWIAKSMIEKSKQDND